MSKKDYKSNRNTTSQSVDKTPVDKIKEDTSKSKAFKDAVKDGLLKKSKKRF